MCVLVDASEAGRGALDLSVGPPGKTLPHNIEEIQPQLYIIEFTPLEPIDHEVNIQFNEVHISGIEYFFVMKGMLASDLHEFYFIFLPINIK